MTMSTTSTKDPDAGARRRVVSLSAGLHAKPATKSKPKPTATQKRRALKRKKPGKAEG